MHVSLHYIKAISIYQLQNQADTLETERHMWNRLGK
jgi:hypothetical protein